MVEKDGERSVASAALPFARLTKINVKAAVGDRPAVVRVEFETFLTKEWDVARVLLDNLARKGLACSLLVVEVEPTFNELQAFATAEA